MMEVVEGVCIFCTENDSVLSNDNKTEFLKIIKINFFSNNRFNFSEFSKLFNKLSICLLCAYKVQCCSNIRDIVKKGDTIKSKRNHDKCCSLCSKNDNVTNGTAQLKQEANQFAKDIKKGNNINIKHICLSCSFAVSVWSNILTGIWNLLNDESADSEKENVTKTDAKHMNTNVGATKTENKIKTTRLRRRPTTENDNKSKSENSAKINNSSDDSTSRNVGKRRRELTKGEATQEEKSKIASTRKRSIADSPDDATPKIRRISARVNSESESSPEETLKRTRRKNETLRNGIEKSVTDSTPVQAKKSRNSEEMSTPKLLRTNRLGANTAKKNKGITSYSNRINKKLEHLNTVNRETRKKNMHLSYNAVTDQRIMFDIPYILCTPYDKESFSAKKTKNISSEVNESFKPNSVSPEKNINTKKGLKNKGLKAKRTTMSSGTTPREANKRQTRSHNTNQKKEIYIEVSSTDDETGGETSPSYRRSGRIRRPTSKALIISKMEKLSASAKRSAAKNQFKCTICNHRFTTAYRMKLHIVKHDTYSSLTPKLTSQNSDNIETNEDTDKSTEDNSTETDEEPGNREQVSSIDSEENSVESSDQHNTNIDSETNKTDENTEETNENTEESGKTNENVEETDKTNANTEEADKSNENTEETKNNEEASIIDEDIGESYKKLDTDKNATEEISEAQSIDKDVVVVRTTIDENDIVEISGKRTSEEQSTRDDNNAINTADNGEEKNNDEINNKVANIDDANEETDDNKLTVSDENSNEQSDTEVVILNENSVEEITSDTIEGICEIINITDTQESEEISVQDKASEENANSVKLTEENANSNNIVHDKLNKTPNEEVQEDETSNPEGKNKIQEETSMSAKEIISEISSSTTSSQDDETLERNLNVIEITEDESSQTTSTCSESAIADINDLDPDIVIITPNKNVSANDISIEHSVLTEQDSKVESLKVSAQGSSVGKTETEATITEECSQKSNGVVTIENNTQQKGTVENFAIVENLLENMGA